MNPEFYLAFDIETVPIPFEEFSESQQEYLLRRAETEEEIQQKKMEMALSPMTARVVCIGMQLMEYHGNDDWELKKRIAFSVNDEVEGDNYVTKTLSTGDECRLSSEKKLLIDFWKIINKYSSVHLISFNGRNFDAPFLMLRSALLDVRPSRNLMQGTKFNYNLHTDLIDELSFYNTSQYSAARRYNFDFYARAFGIKSPKSEGIDGSKVPEFFYDGRIEEISEYCLRDVDATWELFLKWRKCLKF